METIVETTRPNNNGDFDVERYFLSEMHQQLSGRVKPETNQIRAEFIDFAYNKLLADLKSEDSETRANAQLNLRRLCSIAANRT